MDVGSIQQLTVAQEVTGHMALVSIGPAREPSGTRFTWLVERMHLNGSRPMYWAGAENRVIKSAYGIAVTYDSLKARQIPDEELAMDIAAALNEAYPLDSPARWEAVSHGFVH